MSDDTHDGPGPRAEGWLPAARIRGIGASIFTEMTELANRTGSVNLGQGVPDLWSPPQLLDYAREAIADGHNQYPPAAGVAALRQAVAAHREEFAGVGYRTEDEIVVTTGATEAVAAALLAFCGPGDEVLTFDPCYDAYPAVTGMAGARLVAAPLALDGTGWALDEKALREAVTPRTRVLLLNSPHNPTGKVFTAAELDAIAAVCRDNDLTVITDEVYEHLVYDGPGHVSIASLPGMRERTLAVSGAGKTFNVTGWKIGWACGPAYLVTAVRATKQFLTFATGAPFQFAVARMLGETEPWARELRAAMRERRALLTEGLRAVGLPAVAGEGGYFVQADVRGWGHEDGTRFCRELPEAAGVACVPTSAFYQSQGTPSWLARFAFCKPLPYLEEGVRRLAAARGRGVSPD
ncbi:aminotransferase class I/II-fold pyridoxal phosphate-dependent enzyme [Streptomyces sp. TRM 70351]|uniref:aminotransferase class I/II-fold pyridoxal phosphate-dependent enzyme n=1 Tax=Streptomyces sp. TRM 70351 TaxID=3116552 RepID=UPI002E7B79A7|nr:aminotransferase class I/II-fold pyridoxal phosphate-dependent enzyme [Streptomyces sp. TRM 70351]MEE1930139.1 aminotransferase class I/II-fold pyridoxal phosphate-dependent enzyme [Streptomyces sp. TRM 70351]